MPLLVQTPNRRDLARKAPYPRYLNVLSRKETAVQRQLRRGGSGSYEREMQATLLGVAEAQAGRLVMYDVGAHIGYYSAMVAAVLHAAAPQIVAFEPTPATATLACELRNGNGLRYHVCKTAVSSATGTTQLYLSPKAESSNSLDHRFRTGSVPVDVPVTTIDHYIESGGPIPSFLKIDVETLEHEVLRGAMNTIIQARPYITCELLPSNNEERLRTALAWLEHLDYSFYQILPDWKWSRCSGRDVLKNIDGTWRDWLLVPGSLPTETQDLARRWNESLTACDRSTNVEVPPGKDVSAYLKKKWDS